MKSLKKQQVTASNDAEATYCDARDVNGWISCKKYFVSSHSSIWQFYCYDRIVVYRVFSVQKYQISVYRIVKGCVIAVVRKPRVDDQFKF